MRTQVPRNSSSSRTRLPLSAALPLFVALAGLLGGLVAGPGQAAAQIPGALNATLTASPSTSPAGELVSFTYSARPPAVAPPFPSISIITVTYGDGGSDFGATGSSGQPVSGLLTHTYATPGTYTATLTAMASNGQSGSATAGVTVVSGNATSSWLDAPLSSWNTAGMAIPSAPPLNQSGNDAQCNGDFRGPENPNDTAITAAGWRLFGVYEGGWGVYIAGGQADEDGMCRPVSYQYFVFVNGTFAGTLSPVLMNSRTDGAASEAYISAGAAALQAEFSRYKPSDPLCCPSATTEVSYHINYVGDKPVLVPETASTTPNS